MGNIIINKDYKVSYILNPRLGYYREIEFYYNDKMIFSYHIKGSDISIYKLDNDLKITNYLIEKAKPKLVNIFNKMEIVEE